ncbi:MAG: hypothetical protein AAFU85_15065 [Planctomycetota bacterium]
MRQANQRQGTTRFWVMICVGSLISLVPIRVTLAQTEDPTGEFRERFEEILDQESISIHAANLKIYSEILAHQGDIDRLRSLVTRVQGKELKRSVRFETIEAIDAIRRGRYTTATRLALQENRPCLIRGIRHAAIEQGKLEELEAALQSLLPLDGVYAQQAKVYGAAAAAFGQLAIAYYQANPDDEETAEAVDRCLLASAMLAAVRQPPPSAQPSEQPSLKVLEARRQSDDWVFDDRNHGPAFVLALAATSRIDRLEAIMNSVHFPEMLRSRKRLCTHLSVCLVTTGSLHPNAIEERVELAQSRLGTLPEDVYSSLAYRCLLENREQLADEFASQFFKQLLGHVQAWHGQAPLTTRVRDSDRKLRSFVRDVDGLETPRISKSIAETAIKLVERLRRIEPQTLQGEIGGNHKNDRRIGFPVAIASYASHFESSHLESIDTLQREIDEGLAAWDQAPWATEPVAPPKSLSQALAGRPERLSEWLEDYRSKRPSRDTQFDVIEQLYRQDRKSLARVLLREPSETIIRLGKLQAVSGSVLGYVCECGTAEKAKWAKLAASLGDWTTAQRLVDSMRDPIDQASGYRVIARTLTKEIDAETVNALAGLIEDPNQRLSARLGVYAATVMDVTPAHEDPQNRWAAHQAQYSSANRAGYFSW